MTRRQRSAFRRAVAAYEGGRLAEAERHCRAALEAGENAFDASHLLGVVRSRQHNLAGALIAFEKAIALRAADPDVHNNYGSALAELGRHDDALASYDRALAQRPAFASASNNRGCVLMFLDRFEEAVASHGRALVLEPDNVEYINNLGRALTRLQRYDEALDCYDDAVALKPDFVDALLNRATTLQELKCFPEAAEALQRAAEAGADALDLLMRRAGLSIAAKDEEAALQAYDDAMILAPDRHDLLIGRSAILYRLGRTEEGLAGFERALELGVSRADVLMNRALVLNAAPLSEQVLAEVRWAVAEKSDDADAHNVLALTLMNLDRFDESIDSYKRALELRPHFPQAEWNLGYLCLLRGRFEEGWRHYEARRRHEGIRWTRLSGTEWRGEPIAGKRILLYSEQGLGDTIMFSRYATFVAEMGARVIVGVQTPLGGLMRSLVGDPEVTVHGKQIPAFDYHQSLMSIARLFRHNEASIPRRPYLRAEPARIERWRQTLPAAPLRVGITWEGSGSIEGRSIPLAAFAPLAAMPGVVLVSLQKNAGVEQLDDLPAGMQVETLGPDFDAGPDAFLDTAAVMMSLDLVVACDTALAHLAGALGRPVWIVLKTIPDWRWLLDGDSSIWYPSARLFRRESSEDWHSTMRRVAEALSKFSPDTP